MKIAVYCSSASNLPAAWQEDAGSLGRWIGSHGHQLVYGGVHAGLMATVAQAVKDAGGTVVGVVPVRRLDMASHLIDVRVPAADLCERKSAMQTLADAFVVLPGGYGTLDEFIGTFAHLNFTECHRPVIVLNSDGIFTPTVEQLRLFVERGVMAPERLDILHIASTVEEAIALLAQNDHK